MLFSIVPPYKRASEKLVNKTLDNIADALKNLKSVSGVNIPEILFENHRGDPNYKNLDNLDFGIMLRERASKDLIINKAVPYLDSEKRLRDWIDFSKSWGVSKFVFVGGQSSFRNYPGPTVVQANRIGKELGCLVGNILIAERAGEATRALEKTSSGCDFFVTQVVFNSELIKRLIEEYNGLCFDNGVKPAEIFLSFAPVSEKDDMDFLKWFGVFIGDAEKNIFNGGDAGNNSLNLINDIWNDIKGHKKSMGLNVNLNLNIEHVSAHNFNLACDLAKELVQ